MKKSKAARKPPNYNKNNEICVIYVDPKKENDDSNLIGIWRCFKRDRDTGRKGELGDVKTAYTCTPTLIVKRAVITHQIFPLNRDCSKRVT